MLDRNLKHELFTLRMRALTFKWLAPLTLLASLSGIAYLMLNKLPAEPETREGLYPILGFFVLILAVTCVWYRWLLQRDRPRLEELRRIEAESRMGRSQSQTNRAG